MPVEVVDLSIREPDVAQAVLTELYRSERPHAFSGVRRSFICELRSATAGRLGADRLRFTAGMRCVIAPLSDLVVVSPVSGECRYVAGRDEIITRPGVVFRHPIGLAFSGEWDDMDVSIVRLPLAVVERVAEERLGVPPADVRFDGMSPVSGSMRRTWLGLMRFVHQQMADPVSGLAEPLVAAQLTELVAATALATFPNTTMTSARLPRAGSVAPAVVRRAVAFIDAHASLPITVTDVARAAGVGPRALQLAFARHLGLSPTGYMRRVRLEGAHRELQAADPTAGDTVAVIAGRWGFAKPDRFAAHYRATYGVLPSHTLRT
ncbi:AraC family transcriptional regulator [Geodermatophilus nigrescens]|uniref:AraC-type DNA-binding protein n=1 Tax=Geodermatophilus nigrescens TaxID=1070870 RepID=A0A1M5HZF6_9ACTN|nr:AraC family transcriptional regulator [Geodermatophilus nigrescens]SHG21189.1 AraC-type DNA-binding protein [Geodermatophilus nigrescens]